MQFCNKYRCLKNTRFLHTCILPKEIYLRCGYRTVPKKWVDWVNEIKEDPLFGSAWGWVDPKGDLDTWAGRRVQEQDSYLVAVDMYSDIIGKKVSRYYVREDTPSFFSPIFVHGEKELHPFQPFSFVLLGSSRTPHSGSISERILVRWENEVDQVEFYCNSLIVGMGMIDYTETPYFLKSVSYRLRQGRYDEVAKSMFRCLGDLVPRALYTYKFYSFPYGLTPQAIIYEVSPSIKFANKCIKLVRKTIFFRNHPSEKVLNLLPKIVETAEKLIMHVFNVGKEGIFDVLEECYTVSKEVRDKMIFEKVEIVTF